jgi:hypothetical protein
VQKPHRYCFASFVVLDGIDHGLGMISFWPRLELYPIAKLQRERRKKNSVVCAAKLNDGRFSQIRGPTPRRCDLHRNSHGARLREKSRQLLGATSIIC